MTAFSTYLENSLVNHVLRNTAYTPPAALYVGLFTSTATLAELEAGTLTNEVAAGGNAYARQPVTFAAPVDGATSNSAALTWTNMPSVTVGYLAVLDALTAGNVLIYGALGAPKVVNAGDPFSIAIGDLDIIFS